MLPRHKDTMKVSLEIAPTTRRTEITCRSYLFTVSHSGLLSADPAFVSPRNVHAWHKIFSSGEFSHP